MSWFHVLYMSSDLTAQKMHVNGPMNLFEVANVCTLQKSLTFAFVPRIVTVNMLLWDNTGYTIA